MKRPQFTRAAIVSKFAVLLAVIAALVAGAALFGSNKSVSRSMANAAGASAK
jgi:hypothetical protein